MNNKTNILTICMVLLSNTYFFAQQTPVFSEYNYNPFIINSAYAGLTNNTEISISNSGFFNSFEGSPRTFALSAHGQINEGKIGLGAGIVGDQIGVTKSTNFFAAFSYKIFFDFESNRPYWQHYAPGVLSFGLIVGLQQYQDNLADLGIIDDPSFSENINANIPTLGFSFLFNHATFYAGISAPNIIGDKLADNNNIQLNSPAYGYFGYRFFSNKYENIMLKPNMLIKYENGVSLQADINLAVSFKNQFEIGGGYRTTSSYNLLAGVYLIDNFRVVYNYNIAANNSPLGNTHGFILSFQLNEGYKL